MVYLMGNKSSKQLGFVEQKVSTDAPGSYGNIYK